MSDIEGFKLYDGTTNDYGAPSGPGIVIEIGHGPGAGNAAHGFFRGDVTASRIQGISGGATGKGARMWLDFTAGDPFISPAGGSPGVSPYWAITDNNGVIRVEGGYLAARGLSPLQWGLRVNDSGSNPIFDTDGLIGVMALVVNGNGLNGSSSSSSAAPIGQTFSFDVPKGRVQNFLAIATLRAQTTGLSQPSCFYQIFIDGQLSMTWAIDGGAGTPINNTCTLFLEALGLSEGTHTVGIQASNGTGNTTLVDGTLRVYRLGA